MRRMTQCMCYLIFNVIAMLWACSVFAKNDTIVGYWQTLDRKTHLPSSVVEIWEKQGKLYGKVAKIYPENGHKSSDLCEKCKGELFNKPVLNMIILRDLVYINANISPQMKLVIMTR